MKIMAFTITAFTLGVIGCQVPKIEPNIKRKVDIYNGSERVVLSFVSSYNCTNESRDFRTVYFGAMAWKERPTSQVLYSIDAIYRSNDWIFIEPGKTLEAIYWDQPHSFISYHGSQGSRHVEQSSGMVTESATWELSRADLEEMTLSSSVRFRISGNKGSIERCLAPEDRGAILKFLLETKDFK